MELLKKIKDRVAREHGFKNWKEAAINMLADRMEPMVDEVAKRYSAAMCKDLRDRIAESVTLIVENDLGWTEFSKIEKDLGDGFIETIRVYKERIFTTFIKFL